MKIAILHNEIKPFRLPFFLHIEKNYNCVFYCLRENEATKNHINNKSIGKYVRIPKMQDLEIPFDLWSFLKKEKPDIIISTDLGYVITYIGYVYSRLYKKNFILWNEQWADITHPRRWLTKPFEKVICKNSSLILAFGKKQKQYVISNGANENNVINLPNAIPELTYNKKNVQLSNIIKINKKFRLLCPARLIEIKGHSIIIKAINHLITVEKKIRKEDIEVLFLGTGSKYKELCNEIKNSDLDNVIHINNKKYNQNELNYYLTESDVVLLSSTTSSKIRAVEAWGLVINEALSFKKKVIVSNMTGVADDLVLDKITGRIYHHDNYIQLSDLILDSIINNDDWAAYGENGYKLLNLKFSMSVLTSSFDNAIKEKYYE